MESPDVFNIVGFVNELLAHNSRDVYYQTLAAVDRLVLKEVLEHVKGNQVVAADILGISRNTLRSRLRSLGLVIEKQVNTAPDQSASSSLVSCRPDCCSCEPHASQ